MNRHRHGHRPLSARILRSELVRILAVVILAPLLALGTFGGFRILAHAHDGHGFHFHMARTEAAAVGAAAAHRVGHEHGKCLIETREASHAGGGGHHPGCGHSAGENGEHHSPGILIVLPDHEHLLVKSFSLGTMWSSAWSIVPADGATLPRPVLERHIGSPRGPPERPGWSPLRVTERLVRTSGALLL